MHFQSSSQSKQRALTGNYKTSSSGSGTQKFVNAVLKQVLLLKKTMEFISKACCCCCCLESYTGCFYRPKGPWCSFMLKMIIHALLFYRFFWAHSVAINLPICYIIKIVGCASSVHLLQYLQAPNYKRPRVISKKTLLPPLWRDVKCCFFFKWYIKLYSLNLACISYTYKPQPCHKSYFENVKLTSGALHYSINCCSVGNRSQRTKTAFPPRRFSGYS